MYRRTVLVQRGALNAFTSAANAFQCGNEGLWCGSVDAPYQ